MGELINLATYRQQKKDEKIKEEIEYLQRAVSDIIDSLPPMEEESTYISTDLLEGVPFLLPSQTNLDGYDTDQDK